MTDNQTVVVVGQTETDGFGNLWVTPKGGGDRIKIAEKRKQLHPLFEQGKAVMLIWQTYMNKPYVGDAKLVEGELPPPVTPELPAEQQEIVDEALEKPAEEPIDKIERAMWFKEVGELYRAGKIDETNPIHKELKAKYFNRMFKAVGISAKL